MRSQFSELLRVRWYVAAGVLAGVMTAVLVALVADPVYRAESTLLPADTGATQGALAQIAGQFSGLAMMAGLGLGDADTTREAVATLRSRAFSDAFIRDLDVMPVLFPERWNSDRKQWLPGKKPPTAWEGYRRFDRTVRRISENKATGLWTVSIDTSDPILAAIWANELVNRLNREMRSRAISESELTIRYLNEELEKTTVLELRQSIYRLIETQIKKGIIARTRTDYAFKVVDPAIPPDPRYPISPKPVLLLLAGLVMGAAVGAIVGLVRIRPIVDGHRREARRSGLSASK